MHLYFPKSAFVYAPSSIGLFRGINVGGRNSMLVKPIQDWFWKIIKHIGDMVHWHVCEHLTCSDRKLKLIQCRFWNDSVEHYRIKTEEMSRMSPYISIVNYAQSVFQLKSHSFEWNWLHSSIFLNTNLPTQIVDFIARCSWYARQVISCFYCSVYWACSNYKWRCRW